MKLGVCYYPEHWDPSLWRDDARRIAELGLSLVRIGEFAWSELEPTPGQLKFGWLDDAVGVLADAGLEVMLGTPTATPPKWLIDTFDDVLAYDRNGRIRSFGSRRHYCFSSETYKAEARRITEALAVRYGPHAAVTHWQTDNEFGCHDTVRSYSPMARRAFRAWLKAKYHTIDQLNEDWGTVFWSQRYRDFSEIELPNQTVTEANPSHWLDFYRFSSDQVIAFHRQQADIIRQYAPEATITHNAMGHFWNFDHFALGTHVDLLTWDSYPLGFLAQSASSDEHKRRFLRQGDPDFAGFHHDLYRACAPFGVIEQQPGPVNWAPYNPAPLPGMVKLWMVETFAHGGKISSVFRWRQAPFAQEQNHAGLLRPDHQPTPAFREVQETHEIISACPEHRTDAEVALVFDYVTVWMSEIQPQGTDWDYPEIAQAWYAALRRRGLNIDIVPPGRDLSAYKLVVIPCLMHVSSDALAAFEKTDAQLLFGPRCGSKTAAGTLPKGLAPDLLRSLIPLTVIRSETVPDGWGTAIKGSGAWTIWRDEVDTELSPTVYDDDGRPVLYTHGRTAMLTALPDTEWLQKLINDAAQKAGLATVNLPGGLRIRRNGDDTYAFNYAPTPTAIPDQLIGSARWIHGEKTLAPGGFAIWRVTKPV
ncbi:MAG: beta-galactosidase [Pseudomonadota bacterium]